MAVELPRPPKPTRRVFTLTKVVLREPLSHDVPAILNSDVKGRWTGVADEEARVLVLKLTGYGTVRVPFEMVKYYTVSGAPVLE